jgi:hypothetical protein
MATNYDFITAMGGDIEKEKNKKNYRDAMGKGAKDVAIKKGVTPIDPSKIAAGAGIAQDMGILPSKGAAGGAISGASTGAQYGPAGAAVGAVAGAVMGSASVAAEKKARKRKAEATKHKRISEIEENKGKQIAAALSDMGSRMRIE